MIGPYAVPTADGTGGVQASVWDLFASAWINKACDLQPFVTRLHLLTTERYTTTEVSLISAENVLRIEK